MTVERMCQLGGISRSGFYRMGSRSEGVDRDVDLRDAIQRIALEFPSYGRPRITQELRRRGWQVNPKRVYRILREDNLLCLRKRKFVVTTDSSHRLAIYPNLAREQVLNGIDQLWVADLTYVRLGKPRLSTCLYKLAGLMQQTRSSGINNHGTGRQSWPSWLEPYGAWASCNMRCGMSSRDDENKNDR